MNSLFIIDRYEGLIIIDITNPSLPSVVSNYNIPEARDIKIINSFAFISAVNDGIIIIDVNDPYNPYEIGKCSTNCALGVYVVDNFAYIADGSEGLKIIDVSDPFSPNIIGNWNTYGATDVWVKDDLAYVADNYEGLKVIDVSNPEAPVLVGSNYESGNPNYTCGISLKDNFAFTVGSASLKINDISSSESISLIGKCSIPGAEKIFINNNYAFIATQEAGLTIVQIAK